MDSKKLYALTLCQDDWLRVIHALNQESFALKKETQRALDRGHQDYATILWEEASLLNAIADDIDWILPE